VTFLLELLIGWLALFVLSLPVAVAFCRAGHAEDVARGYVDP
jgi:hypothetical protein